MPVRRAVGRMFQTFRRDVAGVGAVEFALVAPILLVLLLAGSELGVALTVDRKVKAAAGAAVDLASQSTELPDTDLRKLMGIARGAIAPYSIAPLQMRLTQIAIKKTGKGTVDWSCPTTGYEKLRKGSPVDVPPEFAVVAKGLIDQILAKYGPGADPTIYIIRGEGRYSFEPVTGEVFGKAIVLSGMTFVQPRYSDKVVSDTDGCTAFSL